MEAPGRWWYSAAITDMVLSMADRFHIGTCPSCREGRLFLFRNLVSGDVYGHCEECEQGYNTPDDLEAKNGGFLTLLDQDDAEWAAEEEVGRSVWANYKLWVADI
ncbi:hypothetical protein [Aquamicrobium terrae]|uniref:Transcription factor zinc-finger domain-containing protein n=1 Tax=Aquamicrobium terrae TaxID=1324945 RepID=A0ABV2N2D7_9HYPH